MAMETGMVGRGIEHSPKRPPHTYLRDRLVESDVVDAEIVEAHWGHAVLLHLPDQLLDVPEIEQHRDSPALLPEAGPRDLDDLGLLGHADTRKNSFVRKRT